MLLHGSRWEEVDEPDPKGVQWKSIQAYLDTHKEVRYVWCDFLCMPQKPRNLAEDVLFNQMLPSVNLLYLGCSVLAIIDQQYIGRFWTQLECWLSYQKATAKGLEPRAESDPERLTIQGIHGSSRALEAHLLASWAGKTVGQAEERLAASDIIVTNQSDKVQQLKKLRDLNETVEEDFQAERRLRGRSHRLCSGHSIAVAQSHQIAI